MVTIPHKVSVADLVEAHRGQLNSPVVGAIYTAPPVGHASPEGKEGLVEVPASSDAPRYLLDLDGPHPR